MKTKRLLYGIVFGLAFLLALPTAASATNVSDIISTDTTWTLANSPYIVTGNVLVQSGVTLMIEPGVTVKFDSGMVLQVDGTLIARGTSGSKITFTSNQATPAPGDWGFIHFTDTSADATFDINGNYTGGSILEYCVVEYAGGLSIANNGAVKLQNAAPFINHCTIRNNSATGILALLHTETLKITNCTISGNSSASQAGGITVGQDSGTVTIENNTISGNSAEGGGGGIYTYNSSIAITNNTISGNSAAYGGGGIGMWDSTVTIENNTISGNSAAHGGGIYTYNSSVAITNNTISGNSANTQGGGIYIDIYSSVTIENNTIINNYANNDGGGIHIVYSIFDSSGVSPVGWTKYSPFLGDVS